MDDPSGSHLMPSAKNLEVEVKFLVADLAAMRRKLIMAGAVLHKSRVFERNVRFDTDDDQLWQRDQLLRLRQDTAVTITFKGISPQDEMSEAKVREELEIKVSDFDVAASIFERLGFQPRQVYEKYRETFHFDDTELVLDEMPFGNFIEIEGSEAAIKTAATALELDWNRRVLTNYLSLMDQIRRHYDLSFNDLTFANFQDLSLSIADLLSADAQNGTGAG